MNIEITGFSAILTLMAFTAVMTFPIKVSASIFGATQATYPRSFFAPLLSVIAIVFFATVLPATIFISPFILLFVFMGVLGLSFIGSVGVTIVTSAAYVMFFKAFMNGASILL